MTNSITDVATAINVLVQGCSLAQSKGAYTLKDSQTIQFAIDYLESINKVPSPESKHPINKSESNPKETN